MRKKPEVGDAVVYHNEKGVGRNALVTCVWSEYMVNVVYVSSNETQKDDYGRQTIRESSVSMIGQPGHTTAHGRYGRYARYLHEEPVPYSPPAAV